MTHWTKVGGDTAMTLENRGFTVIPDESLIYQARRPRSRKRRIRLKWLRDPRNLAPRPWFFVDPVARTINAHPAMIECLRDDQRKPLPVTQWLDDACAVCLACEWSDFEDESHDGACPDCGGSLIPPAED